MNTLFAGTGYSVITEIVLMLTLIAWILFGSRLKYVKKKSYTSSNQVFEAPGYKKGVIWVILRPYRVTKVALPKISACSAQVDMVVREWKDLPVWS